MLVFGWALPPVFDDTGGGWNDSRSARTPSRFGSFVELFLFPPFHSLAFCCDNLLHRAISLIDRFIGVCEGARIGIRNVDFPEWLPSNFVRRLPGRPDGIKQRVVLVRVAVGPTIDRNGLNVICRIETATAEDSGELTPDIVLERFEIGREQDHAASPLLFARGLA